MVDNNLFERILNGRINLKIIVFKRLLDLKLTASQAVQDNDEKTLQKDFIIQEIRKLSSKTQVLDIFKNIETNTNDKEAQFVESFLSYKMNVNRKTGIMNRLQLICQTGFLHGPQYIIALQKIIRLQRELLVLHQEQGKECRIPGSLS